MKICVTGASGFVGTALCDLLVSSGHSVVRAVRRGAGPGIVALGDIGIDTLWGDAVIGCDLVVHLAARVHVMHETGDDPAAEFNVVNTVATRNLVRAAAHAGVKRFVFISTVKVNGEHTNCGRPFSESDIPEPRDDYARSKFKAEDELKLLASKLGMEWVIVRPPLVYGPGVKANFAVLINAVKKGWPLPLGSIHNQRSLIALDNLVDFIVCCTQHPQAANQTFLISDGNDLSTPELVKKLAYAMGVTVRLPRVPVAVLRVGASMLGMKGSLERVTGNLQININKAKTLLNWVPAVTVDQALVRAILATQNAPRRLPV